jgi:hypothetical protein
MTDIVERLKRQDCKTLLDAYDLMEEAAVEIERQGKQLAKWVDIFSEWDSPEEVHEALIGAAKDVNALKAEIEGLRAALGKCLTREAKIQKILDGLNARLAAWHEDY